MERERAEFPTELSKFIHICFKVCKHVVGVYSVVVGF